MKSSPSIWHLLNTYRQIDSEDFIIFCGLLTNHKLTLQCNHLKRKGKCFRIKIINSKALRCTFLGNRKTCLAQNLCNLSYLISQRQEHQRTMQLKVFTCISNFFGPYSKTCIVKLHSAWGHLSRGLTAHIFWYVMKTGIVFSLGRGNYSREESYLGSKLYEEIRYLENTSI